MADRPAPRLADSFVCFSSGPYITTNLIGCGYATDDSTAAEEVNSTVGAKPSRVLVRRTETWHDTTKSEFRHRGQTQESSGNFATVDAERIAGQLSDSK